MKLEDLPTCVKDDGLTLLCMDLLGSGVSRQVYSCTLDPQGLVIKVEMEPNGYFQNVMEHNFWDEVRAVKNIASWFAPVVNISDCGRFLAMQRTKPVRIEELRKKLPKVPAFFTDLKCGNWGVLGNRIVCHDYGTSIITQGISTKMRKAEWWQ